MESDDQAVQTILMGLPEDIYAAIDSYDTAKEIWLCVEQMMKGYDIGGQEKKAKLFNEWDKFNSTDGESIESYYHRFTKLMNDFARNKHLPEWKGHDTTIHQTKNLYEVDYNQLYNFLKMNQGEINDIDRHMQMVEGNGGNQFRQESSYVEYSLEFGYSECWKSEWAYRCSRIANHNANQNRNGNVVAARAEEIEKVNANYNLMANLQQASSSGTQADKALVYDSDGSAEVHQYEFFYNNKIFNMFTQEEQYTKLPEFTIVPHLDQQNERDCLVSPLLKVTIVVIILRVFCSTVNVDQSIPPSSRNVFLRYRERRGRQRNQRPQNRRKEDVSNYHENNPRRCWLKLENVSIGSSKNLSGLVQAGETYSFQMERGIRLMLAPRSAKAKHSFIRQKVHNGIKKSTGVLPIFSGDFLG
ncbi:hypothetical protein Tco_1456164 [Tanacetum coccineum]